MNLIEIYIQEVTRRLPVKNREDIALELESTIKDMLPDSYSEEQVKNVLEKLGHPATLASRYREQPMHLIGPRYFDLYITLLKIVLPIVTVSALISIFVEHFAGYQSQEAVINVLLDIVGLGIWRVFEVGIHVFFWITAVFAILERVDKRKDEQPVTVSFEKWTPEDLKNIAYIPKKKTISKLEVFAGLMWNVICVTIYFYAERIIGIYEGGSDGLVFVTPVFNQEVLLRFWPIILVMLVFEVAFALYKLVKRQWTKGMAIYNAVLQLFGTIIVITILITPNLMTKNFITYMTDLFSIPAAQFETFVIGGGIFIFVLSTVISAFDGFRKAHAR